MKILCINMWLLPFGFSADNKKRLNSLIGLINETQPDIIALQEVWLQIYVSHLKKLNYFVSSNKGIFWNKGGLVIMAKQKPVDSEFFSFPKQDFLNNFSNRGVLKVTFSEFDVFDTHLYHNTKTKKGLRIAMNEFNFLKSKLSEKRLCFICGDLNIEKKDFKKYNNNLFYYLDDVENTFSSENKYIKKWWEKGLKADKKIDYILSNKKIKSKSKVIKSYNNQLLSDHYGILVEL